MGWIRDFVERIQRKDMAMDYVQLEKKISAAVEKERGRLLDLCERLMNIESVTGNEKNVQDEVKSIFEEIGLETDYWIPDDEELKNYSLYADTGESFCNRPVVVGILRGKYPPKGKSLLINGHVDVVTAEPLDMWDTDPFSAAIQDGKLIGRGASDMKTGLCVGIFCTELLKKYFGGVNNDITIVSVPGEENGGNGTAASLMRGYTKADASVFPEPTSNQIQPAHRGAAFWRIYIDGRSSHGGTKYKGVSAVEKGIKVVAALQELEDTRNREICSKNVFYKDYPLSAPVTVGIFRGGQFTSGVPEHCMIEGCIELVPGEDVKDVARTLEEAVLGTCKEDPWLTEHPPRVEWFGLFYNPAQTEPDHPFVSLARECYQAVTGEEPVVNGFEAGTDMRLLNRNFGVPGLMFGAGDIAMAHAPNEYVEIDELIKNAKVMALMMAQWCGIEDVDFQNE